MALHVGKIQRPPGKPHERDLAQFFFEKEFQKRDPVIKQVLDDKNIHPGTVIGKNQDPFVFARKLVQAGNIPVDFLGEPDDKPVAVDPPDAEQYQYLCAESPEPFIGDAIFQRPEYKKPDPPTNRVDHQYSR
jgi:hypothetical protein